MSTTETNQENSKPYLGRYGVVIAAIACVASLTAVSISLANYKVGPRLNTRAVAHEFYTPVEVAKNNPSFADYRGYWKITVANIGDATAEDVKIQLGDSGEAMLAWLDGTVEPLRKFDNELKIGDVGVGTGLIISTWVKHEPKPEDNLYYIAHDGKSPSRFYYVESPPNPRSLSSTIVVVALALAVLMTVAATIALISMLFHRHRIKDAQIDMLMAVGPAGDQSKYTEARDRYCRLVNSKPWWNRLVGSD